MIKTPKQIIEQYAAEQGWTPETCVSILCEYIAEAQHHVDSIETPDEMPCFDEWLRSRVFQESKEFDITV
jgi:hypothetical protein